MLKKLGVVGLLVAMASPAWATTRLQRLAEDRFLLTHKKQTRLAGRGKALRVANQKAASLCEILGYSFFEIKEQESQGRGWVRTAAATIEVKFYKDEVKEDLNNCEILATEEQKVKMRKALDRIDN